MNPIKLKLPSVEVAEKVANELTKIGLPSDDRIVILVPEDEQVRDSGLIIPGSVLKDEASRKGVIVQANVSEEYLKVNPNLNKVGIIANYGIYAGKELELCSDIFIPKGCKLYVLSITEVIYLEINN